MERDCATSIEVAARPSFCCTAMAAWLDFVSSGVMDHASGHRFIAFDRPGFGHSERPRGRTWGPFEQADLLQRALMHLNIERPIVVGHSWGALVALAMALQRAEDVAGLVL